MTGTDPFVIRYTVAGLEKQAEIRPWCKEDNIVDYAIYQDAKLSFTITRDAGSPGKWVVAMKNADDFISDEAVQKVGAAIDKYKPA